jgi:hypothetical protein
MSKILSKFATAAALVLASATVANAGVITFTSNGNDTNKKAGEDWVATFDSPLMAGYTLSLSNAGIYQGTSGVAAAPDGDNTKYLAILGGGSATLTAPGTMKTMSLYLGSIDAYNMITFQGANGFTKSFNGGDLVNNPNGDQDWAGTNRRFFFTFDINDKINKVIFSSSGNSFEIDNIAINDPPNEVPEPLTLSLFASGLAGAAFLRRRRLQTVKA